MKFQIGPKFKELLRESHEPKYGGRQRDEWAVYPPVVDCVQVGELDEEVGAYEGVLQKYNAIDDVYDEFGDVFVKEINDEPLEEGKRYICVGYGYITVDDVQTMAVCVQKATAIIEGGITAGCGITLDEDEISVDPDDLAGAGLEPSETGCALDIVTGCGLEVNEANEVTIVQSDLAGAGLVPAASGCGLDINAGCGLEIDTDVLKVKASDLAGNGLVTGSGCALDINAGCGLEIASDLLKVKASDLAGDGLVVGTGCQLDINAGCGLEIDADVLKVKASDLAGDGLVVGTGCELQASIGCGLAFDETGHIQFEPTDVAGDGLVVGTGCELQASIGCGLAFDETGHIQFEPVDVAGDCLEVGTGCTINFDLTVDSTITVPVVTNVSLTMIGGTLYLNATKKEINFEKNACGVVVNVYTNDTDPNITEIPVCSNCDDYVETNEDTCDCQHCPDGTPSAWSINLTGFTDETCNCSALNVGEVILQRPLEPWTGGGYCFWEAVVVIDEDTNLNVRLDTEGSAWNLSLTLDPAYTCGLPSSPAPNPIALGWTKSFDIGDCCQPIDLEHVSVFPGICATGPETITVTPYTPLEGECLCGPCAEPVSLSCCEFLIPSVLELNVNFVGTDLPEVEPPCDCCNDLGGEGIDDIDIEAVWDVANQWWYAETGCMDYDFYLRCFEGDWQFATDGSTWYEINDYVSCSFAGGFFLNMAIGDTTPTVIPAPILCPTCTGDGFVMEFVIAEFTPCEAP